MKYATFGGVIASLSEEAALLARQIKLLGTDFDGVHTDGLVHVDQDGRESVACSRRDGLGFDMLRKLEFPVCIISKETNAVVAARAKKLQVPYVQAVARGEDKLDVLKRFARVHSISLREVAYIGDDLNDLEVLAAVGLPITVVDAHPEVLKRAKIVTVARGGDHALREIVEIILQAKGLDPLEVLDRQSL